MTTKITGWQPDSCFCFINFSWDDRVSQDERKHTYCSASDAVQLRPDAWRWKRWGRGWTVIHRKDREKFFLESACVAHRHLRLKKDIWLSTLFFENSMKNTVPVLAQRVVPPEHVLDLIEQDSDLAKRLSKRVLPGMIEPMAFAILKQCIPTIRADPEMAWKFAEWCLQHFFYEWRFDEERRLLVDFVHLRLSVEQALELKRLCDERYGYDKVVLSMLRPAIRNRKRST